jgi:hypothetical protein
MALVPVIEGHRNIGHDRIKPDHLSGSYDWQGGKEHGRLWSGQRWNSTGSSTCSNLT